MTPEFIELAEPPEIAGITVRTSNARERDPETAALPGLWARFIATAPAPEVGPPSPIFSVYTDYETDLNGAYTVVLGHEADRSPGGDRSLRLAAGRYAVFTSSGAMPDAVVHGWQQIWAYFARPDAPPRAYTTDFECYDPLQPSTVRIYVAIDRDRKRSPIG